MYTQEQLNNWILSGNPILSTKKPQIYTCTAIELINQATGHKVSIALDKLATLIPVAFPHSVENPIHRTSQLAQVLNNIVYPSVTPTSKVSTTSNTNSQTGLHTGPHAKTHVHLNAQEVKEIENLSTKKFFDIQQVADFYSVSTSVVYSILNATHAKSSSSFIELKRSSS